MKSDSCEILPISLESSNTIHILYGAPKMVPINGNHHMSPLKNGGKTVITRKKEIVSKYNPIFFSIRNRLDFFPQGWSLLESFVVEIFGLPFVEPLNEEYLGKMIMNGLASIEKSLIDNNFINRKRKMKKNLIDTVTYFRSELIKLRKVLLLKVFHDHPMNLELLSINLKNEFFKEKEEPKKVEVIHVKKVRMENDARIDDLLNDAFDLLPPPYRATMMGFDESLPDRIEKNIVNYINTHPFNMPMNKEVHSSPVTARKEEIPQSRPRILSFKSSTSLQSPIQSVSSIIENDISTNIADEYWKISDQLKHTRNGKQSSLLHMINDASQGFTYENNDNDDSHHVFNIDENWSTIPDKCIISPSKKNSPQKQTTIPTILNTQENYWCTNQNSNAHEYLFQITKDIGRFKGGVETHQRLITIWETLGFSISQKLQMLVKYSDNAEESFRLGESLGFWEQALNLSERYQQAYNNAKDYLKLSKVADDTRSANVFKQSREELEYLENALINVSQRLKTSFGDSLIVKHKRIEDLIEIRKQKLIILAENAGIMNE